MAGRSTTHLQGARRRPRHSAAQDAVDVPETEEDGPGDLRTETAIAGLALLAGRLFKKEAQAVARSYADLRSGPIVGQLDTMIEQWTRQQQTALAQGRPVIVRTLTERFRQFENQLNRQLDQQLRAIGVETVAPANRFAPRVAASFRPNGQLVVEPIVPAVSRPSNVNTVPRVGQAATVRKAAKMLEQSAKLVADQVTRRVQGLLEQVDSTVAQAALHNTTELPAIDLTAKTKTGAGAVQRAAVDVTWTYQTAVMAVRYEDAGVQYATWRSQGDTRVRPTHKRRNGQVYKISEGLEGSRPGAEVACRCYPVPKRPGYKPR